MAILIITSETVAATDLLGVPETVKVFSAEIGGRKLSDKWITPETSIDIDEQTLFRSHLIEQGYIFDV